MVNDFKKKFRIKIIIDLVKDLTYLTRHKTRLPFLTERQNPYKRMRFKSVNTKV